MMEDLSQLSDEQLKQAYAQHQQGSNEDLSKLSDDELKSKYQDSLNQPSKIINGRVDLRSQFSDMKQDINNLTNKGVSELATGKSLQDRAFDATSPNISQDTQKPYDSNVTEASNPINQTGNILKQAVAGSIGQSVDMATTPLSLATMGVEPVAKGIGIGVNAIGKGLSNISKSAPNYVTDVVAPKAYQIYQDSVQKFTPEIRKFATDKLKIPQSAVDAIRRNGVQDVQAVTDAHGGSTDPIFQKITDGIQNFRAKADDAYSAAMNSVPDNHLFKINGTYNTLENTLQKYKLVDLKGNPTDRLANADPVYQKMNSLYQDMKSGLVGEGKTIATGRVPKTDFQYYRDSLSRLLRDNPSDRDVMSVKNALYDDADKSGFKGLNNARNLQDQAFDIEKKFASNPLIKEGKLDNFHNLTEANKRDLSSLQSRIGVPFMDDLEKVSAGKYLGKLNEYNPNTFAQDLNKAKDPAWINNIQGKYEDLIGKKNAKDVFDEVRSHVRGQKLKTYGKVLAGAGVVTGGGQLIKDKIFGH